jgi:hypothetical protein
MVFSNLDFSSSISNESDNLFTVGFFSHFDLNCFVISFRIGLRKNLSHVQKELRIILIGGNAENAKACRESLLNYICLSEINIQISGFCNSDELIQWFIKCNLGITGLERHALGKSSSVAAFLDFGLPLAAPAYNIKFSKTSSFVIQDLDSLIITEPNLERIMLVKKFGFKWKRYINATTVARNFINDLISIR